MSTNKFFNSKIVLVANIILVSIILGFVLGIVSFSCSTKIPTGDQVYAQDNEDGLTALESIQYSFRQVASLVLPVVVEINTIDIVEQANPDNPFEFFFYGPEGEGDENGSGTQEYRKSGLGSGVVVKKDGNKVYVLTNYHVVGEAEEISVVLYEDDEEFEAELIGSDERTDLALISFETSKDVPVATLGDSDELFVGDWVLAIGNPFGFQSTVTAGIVSALGREGGPGGNISEFIQTDAAINPGNSGGALVNIKGEVIGINTWIASTTGTSVGYGFAIPINSSKTAIEDFIELGKIEYAWLGISMAVPEELKRMEDDMRITGIDGAFVKNVFKGSPAYDGGILPGDFIIRLNGTNIDDYLHLTRYLGSLDPGIPAEFDIIREGRELSLSIVLAVREEEKEIAAQNANLWPGLSVLPMADDIKEMMGNNRLNGIFVNGVYEDTPSGIAGLEYQDIITKINNETINNLMDFYAVLNDKENRVIDLTVFRDGREIEFRLTRID